jgi:hypothetical protein
VQAIITLLIHGDLGSWNDNFKKGSEEKRHNYRWRKKMEINTCSECGVPEYIASEHVWLNDGLIAQRRDQRHVVVFMESDNLDPLFYGIEQIIGAPIDHIILAARRRAGRAYMDRMIPVEVKELLRKKEIELGPVIESIVFIGQVLGYGRFELVDYRYELDNEDYAIVRIEKPYSVIFGLGDPLAALEALTGYEGNFEFEEVSKDVYEIRAFRSSHSSAFKDRLIMKTYQHGEGDIALDGCPTCGAPLELSSYGWNVDTGIILGKDTGRRMAVFAPTVLDAILDELERELGEAIPEAAVEAQRRLTKTGIYNPEMMRDEGELRAQLALRGLGNLKQIELGKKGLRLRLANAAMHLLIVGLFQGMYEMIFELESKVRWEYSDEGDLEVEVTPRS